uniref:Putative protease Do-like 14 n=1 Tax=Aegilops tauschii TaxID=37682 RepID=M8AQY8_AEGTA
MPPTKTSRVEEEHQDEDQVGADGDPPSTLACTGTVVSHEDSATWILTSATLIRKQGINTEVHEASIAKIEVLLHNKKVVNGQLLMYDLQYNVAVVSIDIQANLPVVVLSDLPESYFLTPSPVVAIARKFESQSLQMKRGNTCRTVSDLDCNELMISTCQIEQVFIGGLLIDLEEKIVGMNFIDDETTPFLPVQVVRGCLTHFKKFREIKQPWLGIRGRALHVLELAKLEKICHRCPKPHSGILVDMIPEASRANCEGVEVGDILNQLDGVVLHSPGQDVIRGQAWRSGDVLPTCAKRSWVRTSLSALHFAGMLLGLNVGFKLVSIAGDPESTPEDGSN